MTLVNQKKPSMPELLQVFVIASGLIVSCMYLYSWSDNLTEQQGQSYRAIGTAISVPFGVVVTLVWLAFHSYIRQGWTALSAVTSPLLYRLRDSTVWNVSAFVFLTYAVVTADSGAMRIILSMGLGATIGMLVRIYKSR